MKRSSEVSRIWYTKKDKAFLAVDAFLLFICLVIFLYPLLFVFASSFSAGSVLKGLSLIPERFSLEGYKAVAEYPSVWTGFANSVLYASTGTALGMVTTILLAYPLSRKDFRFGKMVTGLCMFTMYFSGGMVPTYIWIKQLGLLNTMWSFVIPGALSVYNMIVLRTSFSTQIPAELRDSAQIDGCGEWRYLSQIVLPLSGSVLAVLALYFAIGRWNSYFSEMIYLQDHSKLPLPNILRELLIVNTSNTMYSNVQAQSRAEERAELVKYSLIVVATIPMLILYPFVQKYFVKGVMIGSVKG